MWGELNKKYYNNIPRINTKIDISLLFSFFKLIFKPRD